LLVEFIAVAGTPPVNQALVLTVTDQTTGGVIAKVTIPAGSTALQTTTIPASASLYVFAKDVLTISAAYQQTGGTPTTAANVTAKLRWSM